MAFKDSYGIWRENVFMHKSPKACSTLKKLLGKAWNAIANGYGITKVDCPLLPVNTYIFLHCNILFI